MLDYKTNFYIFAFYFILLLTFFLSLYIFFPVNELPAQLSCPYDEQRLKFIGSWESNNILIALNNFQYLSSLNFFQANNNKVSINKRVSLALKNLDINGSLSLTDNLCVGGVCRSGLNEVRGLIGEGTTGSVAFWIANDEIRGDLNFIWRTSTKNLLINNFLSSSQFKGSLKADYIKSGSFPGSSNFTFLQNLTIANNLYVRNYVLSKATITSNRAFCLSNDCLNYWPWLSQNFIRGTGTDVANYLAKWINSNTIDRSIIYETGGKLAINSTSSLTTLNVNGSLRLGCLSLSATTSCLILPTITQNGFVLTSDNSGNTYWSLYRPVPNNVFILSFDPDLTSKYPNWIKDDAYILLKTQGAWLIPSKYDFSIPYDPNIDTDAPIVLNQARAHPIVAFYKDKDKNIERIYVFGGQKNETSGNDLLNSIEYLGLNTTTFAFAMETTTLPQKIFLADSVFYPDHKKIYIIGGATNDEYFNQNTILNSVTECGLDANRELKCSASSSFLKYKRYGHRAILYKNKILVIGGIGVDATENKPLEYLDKIEYFDLTNTSTGWRISSSSLKTTRIHFAAVLFKDENTQTDNIYIIGGERGNECFKTVEKITLSSSTTSNDPIVAISTATDFVFSISKHDATVFQKRIFVIGGFQNCNDRRLNTMYYYDSNSWRLFPANLKYAIARHSVISFFRKKPFIFLVGGRAKRSISSTSTQVFNPAYPLFLIGDNTYDLPSSHKSKKAASVIYKDKIFYIGGDDSSNYSLKKVSIFDLGATSTSNATSSKWKEGPSIQKNRGYAQAVVVKGYGLSNTSSDYIYLIGGQVGSPNQPQNSISPRYSVEVFNLSEYFENNTSSWFFATASFQLPTPRTQHGAVVINNKIFVVGGKTPKGTTYEVTSSILFLDPHKSFEGANKWQYVGNLKINNNNKPLARFAIVPWNLGTSSGFYVIGGEDENNNGVDFIIKCDVNFGPPVSLDCNKSHDMKFTRIEATANLVGNEVIILGGFNFISGSRSLFDSIEKFDLLNTSSSTLYLPTVLSFQRYGHVSQVYNRKIYVIGGRGGNDGTDSFLVKTEIFSNPIYYLYYYLYGRQ